MKRSQFVLSMLIGVSIVAVAQESAEQRDCRTWKYTRHKVSCLCGEVSVCVGDICGGPSVYGLDNDIDVELRDEHGNTLQSKTLSYDKQRKFCFEGQRDGEYQIAFVVRKKRVAQPAVVFPTNLKKARKKPCDSIYMVEPDCPI